MAAVRVHSVSSRSSCRVLMTVDMESRGKSLVWSLCPNAFTLR